MKSSGSGLRYWIDGKGYGIMPEAGDRVSLLYTVTLLTGDTIYSSDQDGGPLTFRAGRAEVISGLEEGILLMKEGDQAKFIIPSHLAYGLTGDQEKIRDKVTLVYDIKLLSVGKVH
jgi:FKBP-type peptidyl-prolyl cis-trans isomerase